MQNINLYKLMSELYARPEVEDADIVSCMYTDDTIKRSCATARSSPSACRTNIQRSHCTPYTPTTRTTDKEPLTEGLHYDFEDDSDYKDGVEAIIKEAC